MLQYLDRLEEWAGKNSMKLNKDKCKVLHLAWNNWRHQYRLASAWLGNSLSERDLRVLVDNKLNMSQQWAAAAIKANQILGCSHRGITSRDRDVIIPLYSVLVRLHLEYDVDRLETVQRRTTKMIKKLENLSYEEILKELEEKAPGDLITVFQYLKGGYKEGGGSLFTRSHMEKTWGNRHKLYWKRIHLDTRKKFFTVRTINKWNNLPRNMVESLSLEVFKTTRDARGYTGVSPAKDHYDD
ncbi:hypothetical protein QYF61_016617 [Mycteria americana]|uniref:Reverse transcriptase n=1 Tax=Mycteria americana TaxID=33587 RepID=A0AAN7NVC6_MYCAM|nr:hypothetical protein QYF61_016617 [Mycteria americana]